MEEGKTASYGRMLIPSILSVSMLTIMAPTAVAPALAVIKDYFGEISDTQAKLVLTLPTLVMMPMGVVSAKLAARFDKKKLLLIGMTLFLIFGAGGGLVDSFEALMIMRGLFGVGLGLMTPLSTSLIFDFEKDPMRRNKLMGWQGANNQFGGLVFMALSGVLASISWRHSFLTYTFVIVSIILCALFIPSIPPIEAKQTAGGKKKVDNKLYVLAFFAMLVFACYFVINTDLALFMSTEKLGDTKDSGFALSVMRIPAIFAGICLAAVMKRLKDWTMPVALVVMATGYIIISMAESYAVVILGSLVVGLGGGFSLPPATLFIPRIVTPSQRTFAVAILSSVALLGQFVSPLLTGLFIDSEADDASRMRFVVCAIMSVVLGVVMWLFARTLPKKPLEE